MIDYQEKRSTNNRQYYASELRHLKESIKSKYRGKLREGVLLLQDSMPIDIAQVL